MKTFFINISDLMGQPVGTSDTIKISQTIPSPDPENIKNNPEIQGQVNLTKLENTILGVFELKTQIDLNCARCLKKYQRPINLNYHQEFSYQGAKQTNPDIQYTINKNKLDILPSIRQEIILAIPVKPLCDKRCKIN